MEDSYELIDVLAFDLDFMGSMLPEIYQAQALIFLYPLSQVMVEPKTVPSDAVFYMKQTVENACGSIALIHALANNTSLLSPESHLSEFVDGTKGMSPEERGNKLEADEKICQLHASFSAQGQTDAPDAEIDVDLHFVAFVPGQDGRLYELDGRQAGLIDHGHIAEEEGGFFSACCSAILSQYLLAAPDAQFTAMALVPVASYIG